MTLKIYKTKISGAGLRRVLSPKILLFAFFVAIAAGAAQAATFTVSSTGDAGDGTCDATCTLRDAILSANAQAGDDVIEFDAGAFAGQQTITLGGTQLSIANNGALTINGTGANRLSISGNNASRVFNIASGARLTLNGVTITGGRDSSFGGGGILNGGTLNITNSTISGNSANGGGGISNPAGTVNLTNSTVSDNSSSFSGGGILNGGTFNITNSTVSNNSAPNNRGGGGIYSANGILNITNSTISGNSAAFGGGIFSGNGTVNITNSTISGNSAINDGGGILHDRNILNLTNSTISGNSAINGGGIYSGSSSGGIVNLTNITVSGNSASGGGGGIYLSENTTGLRNSIISGNTGGGTPNLYLGDFAPPPFYGENNIIGDEANVRLAPLGFYGGATQTHALLPGSIAVNAGNNCVLTQSCATFNAPVNLTTDQRGAARVGTVDIGAFELDADTDGDGVLDFTDNCPTTYNPERIAFVALGYSFDDYNIYVMNADGTGLTDLTANTVSINWEPAFSPDGSKIAFTSRRDGNYQIYIMNADGTNQTRLSNNGSADFAPTFSPDGSKIAFTSSRDGNYQIYIMNADGTNQTRLTNNGVQGLNPTFSPDGSKIAFSSYSDNDIYIMNADGTGITNLTNSPGVDYDPVFSPDGSKIYFVFAGYVTGNFIREIYVMNTDGTNRTRVTNNWFASTLAPSADGTKFIYSATGETGYSQLYVINTDGTNATRLTNFETDLSNPAWGRQPDSDGDGTGDACETPDDTTPPVITPTVTGTLGNNDWYRSDVQVSWSVSDAESSVSNQTNCHMQTVSTDTAGITFTCQATSAGGTSSNSVTIKRDTTAPTITFASRTAPNAQGWNKTNVAVQWTCADALSGAVGSSVSTIVSTEGANQSALGICTDNAGNTAQNTQGGINIDKTAPGITFDSRTAPNANGWNNTNVQVNWSCSDALSGVVLGGFNQILSSEGANQSATGTCTDNAGNTAQDTQSAINIDKTAPSITFDSRTPAANGSGWNNSDVTINWNCADTLSGAVNQAVTQTLGTEGASQSASGTCTDLAGNTVSDTQGGINIDKTAPTISLDSRTPAANANGWNNSDVAVIWNCSDVLSGAVNSSVTQILTTEGANQSAAGTCVDLAGNQAQDSQGGINIDKTNPTITFDSRTAPNSAGWNNANVTVNWNCSDLLSGAASLTVNQTLTTEGANLSAGGMCFDLAGNSASDTQTGIKIDKTAPSISFVNRTMPNAAGWNNTAVTVNWNCSDVLSGTVSSTAVQILSSEGWNQTATGTCTDNAGNTVQNTQSGISIDTTAPTLAPVVMPNPILRGGSATASANAADTLSGIASQSCDAVNTSTFGSFSVNCTATDNAGNTATVPASYRVIYNFTGFFQPIANLPVVNEVNAGQSIPIKFSLNGYQGMNIFAAGFPVSGMVGCSENEPGSTVEEIATPGSSGLSYSAGSDQYNYVWKTNKAWKGTCRILVVRFIDGSEYYAKFRFR